MNNLFVYGTLQESEVQIAAMGRVAESKEDILLGHARSKVVLKGITYDILVKGKQEIQGLVLSVTEGELKRLDIFETKAYRRVEAVLKSGMIAWVYVK